MKRLHIYLYLALVAVIFAGCGVEKSLVSSSLPQTVCVDKAVLKVADHSLTCSMQVLRDSITYISVQPLMGIEMFRIESTPNTLLVINKIKKNYIQLDMPTLWTLGLNVGYKDIEKVATGEGLKAGQNSANYTFDILDEKYEIGVVYPSIRINQPVSVKKVKLNKYKRVTIHEVMP